MNVSELITELAKYDPQVVVVIAVMHVENELEVVEVDIEEVATYDGRVMLQITSPV